MDFGLLNIFLQIILPKMSTERLHRFIEKLYYEKGYIWYSESSYGPKEEGAGCYYEIIQKENQSIIDMYCGCGRQKSLSKRERLLVFG